MPITVLYEGKGANGDLETELDIVAIHGLNSGNNDDHSIDTWRTPARRNGHLWLKDSLPNALPQVRTMLYNYNSNPAFGSGKDRFVREASQLLEHLAMRRAEHSDGPLILLGHSLGGILIKQALVNAHANPMHKPIIDSTFGLVFMGTPHDGQSEDAKINFGKICAKLVRQISGNEMVDLVQAVENGSLFSDILKENWRHQLENYQVISCYEVNSEVVPYDSAVLGLPGSRETVLRRNAGHSDVCRFNPKSKIDACDYELFEHNLKNMVEAALKGGEAT
ncbi:hypothetical protein N431DRAFT_139602 [Stipitochalara longipes BDJ]|nr:hypothetical protein N431DRAFT_139602 [Stipitochalara longipes BDJ]